VAVVDAPTTPDTQDLFDTRPRHVLQAIQDFEEGERARTEEVEEPSQPRTEAEETVVEIPPEPLDEDENEDNPDAEPDAKDDDVDPIPPPDERLDHDYPLMEYKEKLDGIVSSPKSDDNWADFEKMMEDLIEDVRDKAKIKEPEPRRGRMKNRKPQTDDARYMQRLYMQNRRKVVRLIVDPNLTYCNIPKAQIQEHFKRLGEQKETDHHIYKDPPANRPNLPMRSFRH